jgi:hypothetical protein
MGRLSILGKSDKEYHSKLPSVHAGLSKQCTFITTYYHDLNVYTLRLFEQTLVTAECTWAKWLLRILVARNPSCPFPSYPKS